MSLRLPLFRTLARPRRRPGDARGDVRENPAVGFPLGQNDLELDLPRSFEADAGVVFKKFAELAKAGVVLQRRCDEGGEDCDAALVDTAARMAWLAGAYFALVHAGCDDWDDHGREQAINELWDTAGRFAIEAVEGVRARLRDGGEVPDFRWVPARLKALLEAPDMRGMLRERAEARQRVIVSTVTRVLLPELEDELANLMLRDSGAPCEVFLYWSRMRGAEDARRAWGDGYAPESAEDAAGRATPEVLAKMAEARLGAALSWMELQPMCDAYNSSYAGMIGVLIADARDAR
jgi:hypothetical protein